MIELARLTGRAVRAVEEALRAMGGRYAESLHAPLGRGERDDDLGEHLGGDEAGFCQVEARGGSRSPPTPPPPRAPAGT